MGRPREFDPERALEGAMALFWARGYEAASLEELLEAMGIARGSLYKAFRSKRRVFLMALELYDRTVVEALVRALGQGPGSGAERVRRLLAGVARDVAEAGDRRGCFLCNAAVGEAQADPEVAARVMAMMRRLEAALADALAGADGAPAAAPEARAETARLLLAAYMGLRVLARAGYPAAELEALARGHAARLLGAEGDAR